MSLKIKTAARLKALFPGVALSKKSVEAVGDQFAKAGLTDDSTDEEIDAKLNDRNALYSFEDQKKYEDYLAGKAAKERADADRAAAAKAAAGAQDPASSPAGSDDDIPSWAKALIQSTQSLAQGLEAIKGEKVANTRREQYIKALEGTSKTYQERELKKFDRMKFETDDEFNEFLDEAKTFASDAVQEDLNGDLGSDRPAGGNGNPDSKNKVSDAEIDSLADAIL